MRLTGLTRTKLVHVARMAASASAVTPHTRSACREMGANSGTMRPSAACQAAAWARPLAKAGRSEAHVHWSQPERVAK